MVSANLATSETFIVDFELGMFACQVDSRSDHLLLFNISSMCDGLTDCASAIDEDVTRIECRSKYRHISDLLLYFLH